MSETDRLTDEEKLKQAVLLQARGYLVTLLGKTTSDKDKAQQEVAGESLDKLILANQWLVELAYRTVRGGYSTYTPLSELGESVRREMGEEN